ncbi:MAG: hypothetical protein HYT28_00345 [Parcubacteria group bacterium]|nr:hypothetical protein [Parcubacteria group bacterium]
MKTKDGIFMEILEWAYEKQEGGFLEEDLIKKFILTPKEKNWYIRILKPDQSSDRVIEHVEYLDAQDKHRYAITAKGVSTIIEYRMLKEAERSGTRATRIAISAIVIGVAVGVVQIIIGLL